MTCDHPERDLNNVPFAETETRPGFFPERNPGE